VKVDWDTLQRAGSGDNESWKELWRAHQPRLKALAFLVTGSVAASDDIAQETLLRAVRARVRNHDGTVAAFLGTIAYRLALKEIRRRNRHTELSALDRTDNGNAPLEKIVKNEQERILAESIHDLSSEHREALVLKFYAELSYDAIAKILDIPAGTARSRVFYAVQACRKKMRERGLM
jgi:RNA polymerase sigma-70 factor (ECF subfamily)